MITLKRRLQDPDTQSLAEFLRRSTQDRHPPSLWYLYRYGVRQPVYGGVNRISDNVGPAPMLGPRGRLRTPHYSAKVNPTHNAEDALPEPSAGRAYQGRVIEGGLLLPELNPEAAVNYNKFVGYKWIPPTPQELSIAPPAPDRLYKNQLGDEQIAKFQKQTAMPSMNPRNKIAVDNSIKRSNSMPARSIRKTPNRTSLKVTADPTNNSEEQKGAEKNSATADGASSLQAIQIYNKAVDSRAMAWVIEGVSRERIEALNGANALRLPVFVRSHSDIVGTSVVPRSVTRERGRYKPVSRVSLRPTSRQKFLRESSFVNDVDEEQSSHLNSRSVYAYNQMLLKKHCGEKEDALRDGLPRHVSQAARFNESSESTRLKGQAEEKPNIPSRGPLTSPPPPPSSHHEDDDDYDDDDDNGSLLDPPLNIVKSEAEFGAISRVAGGSSSHFPKL